MRHALRVHDFTYNFNEDEMELYNEMTRAFSKAVLISKTGFKACAVSTYAGNEESQLLREQVICYIALKIYFKQTMLSPT